MRNNIVRAVIEVTLFWSIAVPVVAVLLDESMIYVVSEGLRYHSWVVLSYVVCAGLVGFFGTLIVQKINRMMRLHKLRPQTKDFITSSLGSPLMGKDYYAEVKPIFLPEIPDVDYAPIQKWIERYEKHDGHYMDMLKFIFGYHACP